MHDYPVFISVKGMQNIYFYKKYHKKSFTNEFEWSIFDKLDIINFKSGMMKGILMNIITLFDRESDRIELIQVNRTGSCLEYSHNDILENLNNLCIALQELGISDNDKILILSGNTVPSVISVLAAFNLGAVAVPVNPNIGYKNIGKVIKAMEPGCCIFENPLHREIKSLLEKYCSLYISLNGRVVEDDGDFYFYKELTRNRFTGFKIGNFEKDRPALVVHTSGSTGDPKPVVRTHGGLSSFIKLNNTLFSQYYEDKEDKYSHPFPIISIQHISHLSTLGYCFQGLYTGSQVYLMDSFNPKSYLKLVLKIKSKLLILIPSMYELILKETEILRNNDFSFIKFCLYAGEICPDNLIERIEKTFEATAISIYGLTECLTGIGHARKDIFGDGVKRGSCGSRLFGEVILLDNNGKSNDKFGEAWINNSTVVKQNSGLRPEKLQNAWFKTGDMLFRDKDGHYFYKGRSDDMFICNGNNIYPCELEKILLEHPSIDSVCVVPIRDRKHRTVPAVMIRQSGDIMESDVIDIIIESGPVHLIPRFIGFSEELPVSGTGKIRRSEVSHQLQEAYDKSIKSRNYIVKD